MLGNRGFPRLDPAFVYAKASFLMTFAMGGVPHAGSHVTQLCPTLCNLMDCSLPGSCVRRVLQARMLEWIVIPSSGVFPRHEPNLDLLHCRQIVYHLSHREDNQPTS